MLKIKGLIIISIEVSRAILNIIEELISTPSLNLKDSKSNVLKIVHDEDYKKWE